MTAIQPGRIDASTPPLDTPDLPVGVPESDVIPAAPVFEPLASGDEALLATQPAIIVRTDPSPMGYVDGFVIPVPASRKDEYVQLARQASAIFKEYGATRVVECWGDDVRDGDVHDFKRAAVVEGDEVVVFSWIEYPSKRVRDAANEKIHQDPRMKLDDELIPFDAKRMAFGGFIPLVDTREDAG